MARPKQVSDEQILTAARTRFLRDGVGVSAAEIARELGVSHTTVLNRFGSKEALMVAALGPPLHVPWVAALNAGPDERPIRDQLVEHATVMSGFYRELMVGVAVLRSAGVDIEGELHKRGEELPPAQAMRALTGWLVRAQQAGRLAECDVETLAATLLGALHNWAFTAQACGFPMAPGYGERHVERLIDLLWHGIAGRAATSSPD